MSKELASAIRAALKEFEGVHTWRNHEAAVRLYLKDLDAFETVHAGGTHRGRSVQADRPVLLKDLLI